MSKTDPRTYWNMVPQQWRDRIVAAGLTYLGVQYGPLAKEAAKCIVGY